ncbi:hypothetical protein ACPOL_3687 [Acidisarcina polymorpha]|uniref:Uncharacterized protein n=1 Tax=Acidisarcina polymorpha TaxID=2211140 RepID=A0A2Z5G1L2_9BACT|nr:hypothetical protein ACPOL_3687 [Acidisarcina polymorpha]
MAALRESLSKKLLAVKDFLLEHLWTRSMLLANLDIKKRRGRFGPQSLPSLLA